MSTKPRILDVAFLRERYTYNPETGHVSLRKANQRSKAGHVYTTGVPDQYITVPYIKGVAPAHRVAWVLMTGEQPNYIDHINGLRHDNRWSNLRSVTASENARNTRKHRISRGDVEFINHLESEYVYSHY